MRRDLGRGARDPQRSRGLSSAARPVDFARASDYPLASATATRAGGEPVGSVIKKRRKKMRKHKKRKLLRRARHKRKR